MFTSARFLRFLTLTPRSRRPNHWDLHCSLFAKASSEYTVNEYFSPPIHSLLSNTHQDTAQRFLSEPLLSTRPLDFRSSRTIHLQEIPSPSTYAVYTHTTITYARLITLEICAHVLARFSSVLQILATPLARHDRALSRIIYNPPSTLAELMNSSFCSREYSRDQWNQRNDSTQQISFRSVGYRVRFDPGIFLFLLCKFAFK